jgi:hypothetical protein
MTDGIWRNIFKHSAGLHQIRKDETALKKWLPSGYAMGDSAGQTFKR